MSAEFLKPIAPAELILARLAAPGGTGRTSGQFAATLRAVMPKESVHDAISELRDRKWLAGEEPLKVTSAGVTAATRQFGRIDDRKKLDRIILPALALGLDPKGPAASRLANGDTLRAVVLTRLFDLPLAIEKATLSQAVSAMIVRGIASSLTTTAVKHLSDSARDLGDLSDLEALRRAVARLAIRLALPSSQVTDGKIGRTNGAVAEFAKRVTLVTAEIATPPFTHKTAIAQVYDAYGRRYADAGDMGAFKQRLVDAYRAHELTLLPLDDPNGLDKAIRVRSEIVTRTERLHFVQRQEKR